MTVVSFCTPLTQGTRVNEFEIFIAKETSTKLSKRNFSRNVSSFSCHIWCFAPFDTICAILNNVKNIHDGVLLLVKLQVTEHA